MVYTSNNWNVGDLITAAKMNNLETQWTEAISAIKRAQEYHL